MADRLYPCGLNVSASFHDFIVEEVLPGSGLLPEQFWQTLRKIVDELGARNVKLLQVRNDFQAKIDAWHRDHLGSRFDAAQYRKFLCDIGYIVPTGPDFEIATENVDAEIAIFTDRLSLDSISDRLGSGRGIAGSGAAPGSLARRR